MTSSTMTATPAEAFSVSVPDEALEDVQTRLRMTDISDDLPGDDWSYGMPGSELASLVDHWLNRFDWRQQEQRINAFSHFRTHVDGLPIHFIHERGTGPAPIPLVLTHGWPWTFWDFAKVIGPLTDPASHGGDPADAFDVVVPSLPGFTFSTPLTQPGVNFWKTADLWVTLMSDVLGYRRFGAHGGDWGALITGQLGHKYAHQLIGIHTVGALPPMTFSSDRPWVDVMGAPLSMADPAHRPELLEWERRFFSHMAVHMLDPKTLAHAMMDSPAGLAAWLVERRRNWSDCHGDVERSFSKDELLTHVMLYWLTRSFGSSARYYAETAFHPWTPSHDRTPAIEVPTGISVFEPDAVPGASLDWLPQVYNVSLVNRHASGGHFAPAERPDAVVEDIRQTFRPLR